MCAILTLRWNFNLVFLKIIAVIGLLVSIGKSHCYIFLYELLMFPSNKFNLLLTN